MGKDKKNREIGKGLSQRKDGRYSARFLSKTGERVERYFETLPEARNWLEDAKHEDKHKIIAPFQTAADVIMQEDISIPVFSDMTVDEWFNFWMENIIPDLRGNTLRNYSERYAFTIRPFLGNLKIKDVRSMHCKSVLLNMEAEYSGATIKQTYIVMGTMFRAAVLNGVIPKHPMDGLKYVIRSKSLSDIKVLTVKEQEKFLAAVKYSQNYNQYMLILETGLRTGELIGLTWDSIDFKNKTLTVNKSLEYRHSRGTWEAGPPKTKAAYRTIPLTTTAYNILSKLYYERNERYEAPELNQVLEFRDKITGEIRTLNMKDVVFVNSRFGMPTKNSSYDTHLYKICDDAGIKHISMHVLRHTFATRAIERGVHPKALQVILGHSTLHTTMEIYVHVTDDSKLLAIKQFEENAPASFKMA